MLPRNMSANGIRAPRSKNPPPSPDARKERSYDGAPIAPKSSSHLATLAEMRADLTCSLCFDLFVEPKTLICAHTFCDTCVNRLVDDARCRLSDAFANATIRISCPLCREVVDMPESGGFSTNTVIKGIYPPRDYCIQDQYVARHVVDLVSKLKELRLPKRDDMMDCDGCRKLTDHRELFICTDVTHQTNPPINAASTSSPKGDGPVLCAMCILLNGHRDHNTLPLVLKATAEDREKMVTRVKAIGEGAKKRVKIASHRFRDELEKAVEIQKLDSIIAEMEKESAIQYVPELQEKVSEAQAIKQKAKKVMDKLNETEMRKQVVDYLLGSSSGVNGAAALRRNLPPGPFNHSNSRVGEATDPWYSWEAANRRHSSTPPLQLNAYTGPASSSAFSPDQEVHFGYPVMDESAQSTEPIDEVVNALGGDELDSDIVETDRESHTSWD